MRWAFGLVLILCLSVTGVGFPHRVFPALPGATSLGDPGRTGLSVAFLGGGPSLEVGRAIGARLDVWARIDPQRPFSLWARAVILRDLGPLSVAVDLAADRLRLDACLFLGPVHVDWGRSLEAVPHWWGIVTVAPNPWLSLILGVEVHAESGSLVAGAHIAPFACGPVASLLLRDRRLVIGIVGAL
jgi:hypothetical protein